MGRSVMGVSKNDVGARFRRLLDKIDSEQPRPGDGESVAFKDICEHIAEGELEEADALLAQVEGPAFARHVVRGRPLATVPTTAYWREQLSDLGC